MINYLKSYEATKPKQHALGMSYMYLGSTNDIGEPGRLDCAARHRYESSSRRRR